MNFEEYLLMELKAEIVARRERRRRAGRRLLAGAAVAGLAAAAAIAVPLLTGSETRAYAVTRNADGTIRVEVNEFRDADKLEKDLEAMGVVAAIDYVKPGKKCQRDRGTPVDGGKGKTFEEWQKSVSYKAAHPREAGVDIDPKYVAKGNTLVMEFTENEDQTSGPEKPRALWRFKAMVVTGAVKPCAAVDDATWSDRGGPEGRPPAGS
ncbi:hypothetical protein AB0B45_21695 [Nonomuraea sp. NPDC049152]|uniref:hypothetical protein n=1 Tax=Nonomuraea sp. NPDC049152 TaxID=3154350 RepID=UPI0033FF30AA